MTLLESKSSIFALAAATLLTACSGTSDGTGSSSGSSSGSTSSSSSSSSGSTSSSSGGGEGSCTSWRQTGSCSSSGAREPANDKACSATIVSGASGFCECESGDVPTDCSHAALTCNEVCAAGSWESTSSSSGSSGWGSTSTCNAGAATIYECCALGGGSCETPSQYASCCETSSCGSGKIIACLAKYSASSVDACNAALSACD